MFAAEPVCQSKVRKIRKQRDAELEEERFDKEGLMMDIRLDRDKKIANITAQERDQLERIRAYFVQRLERVLASQGQCEMQGDAAEDTCRTEWNQQGPNSIDVEDLGQGIVPALCPIFSICFNNHSNNLCTYLFTHTFMGIFCFGPRH